MLSAAAVRSSRAGILRQLSNKHRITTRMLSSSSSSSSSIEDDVIFENINTTKIITLNRPQKLNSLNMSMVDKIYPRLSEYAKSQVTELVIQKANGRAFCAGGDVSACVESNKKGQIEDSLHFFQKEYSMNYLAASYPKPIVSLMDGITMGGGVGLSVHTPFRVATEKTRWAMPEMDIGFSPDVGATFALNHLVPSSFGWFLALTGENVVGWDCYFMGIATHYVPSHRLKELTNALANTSLQNADPYVVVNNVLEDFTEPLPQDYQCKYTVEQLRLIERVFHERATIESIFEALKTEGSEFALQTLVTLEKKSPLSLKVGLEILQRGSKSNIHEALTNELHAAKQFMKDSDFNEGVTSKLIKKSKEVPNWKHKTPSEVAMKELFPFFKVDKSLQLDNHFNVTFTEYPHNFGLPKESEIKSFVQGEDGAKTPGSITKKDVFQHFNSIDKYRHKAGLNQYLKHVLDSKVNLEGELLSWKL